MSAVPWGFEWRGSELHCEQLPARELVERFGTPLYVYSRSSIEERFTRVARAFGPDALVCFAVKSNPNRAILRLLESLGSGFDIVSGGELARLRAAGCSTARVVFAGVGKHREEIRSALDAGILLFNVESEFELDLLEECGSAVPCTVPVAVRLNPDVRAGGHAYIATAGRENKFGVDLATAARVVERIRRSPVLALRGYHVHLGSQLDGPGPYLAAFDRVAEFMDRSPLHREHVEFYDLGGGFGIGCTPAGAPFPVEDLADLLLPRLRAAGLRAIVEPGRFVVGDAGVLLTRVLGRKDGTEKRFVVVDAAMNDLLRPALYGAEHPIRPVRDAPARGVFDVVGPVCESGDFLGRARELPELEAGDLLAVLGAGAYGAAMASNYNSRPRPAEVLVHGTDARLVARRERLDDLWAREDLP